MRIVHCGCRHNHNGGCLVAFEVVQKRGMHILSLSPRGQLIAFLRVQCGRTNCGGSRFSTVGGFVDCEGRTLVVSQGLWEAPTAFQNY